MALSHKSPLLLPDGVLAATSIPLIGSHGSPPALVVLVVPQVAGSQATALGARTVAGVDLVAAVVGLVASALGAPKHPVSTVTRGPHGLLAGEFYLSPTRYDNPLTSDSRGSFSSWTGTWSGCSSTTASPVGATVTTTVTGSDGSTQVLTGTTFGIQAVESDSGAGPIAVQVSTARGLGLFVALAAGVFGAMVAL